MLYACLRASNVVNFALPFVFLCLLSCLGSLCASSVRLLFLLLLREMFRISHSPLFFLAIALRQEDIVTHNKQTAEDEQQGEESTVLLVLRFGTALWCPRLCFPFFFVFPFSLSFPVLSVLCLSLLHVFLSSSFLLCPCG